MPSNLPLSTVIVEILRHTPPYVWAILVGLIALGLLQWRDHAVSRTRLSIAPIALGLYSLWGATLAFGLRGEVVAAWLAGMALALVANRWLRWPRAIGIDAAGRCTLRGSPWPMVAMLAIFCLRYAVAVTLVFHRDWAADPLFSGAIALLYGALSGLFAARALRILRSSEAPRALAVA